MAFYTQDKPNPNVIRRLMAYCKEEVMYLFAKVPWTSERVQFRIALAMIQVFIALILSMVLNLNFYFQYTSALLMTIVYLNVSCIVISIVSRLCSGWRWGYDRYAGDSDAKLLAYLIMKVITSLLALSVSYLI